MQIPWRISLIIRQFMFLSTSNFKIIVLLTNFVVQSPEHWSFNLLSSFFFLLTRWSNYFSKLVTDSEIIFCYCGLLESNSNIYPTHTHTQSRLIFPLLLSCSALICFNAVRMLIGWYEQSSRVKVTPAGNLSPSRHLFFFLLVERDDVETGVRVWLQSMNTERCNKGKKTARATSSKWKLKPLSH